MPRYEECMAKASKIERVKALESAMNEHIGDRRFFSYIQLHEFEALLFLIIMVLSTTSQKIVLKNK